MDRDIKLSALLTIMGGLGFIMGSLTLTSGLLMGIGIAFSFSGLMAFVKKKQMLGGWAGAAMVAPGTMTAYFGTSFIANNACADLEPGIFFLVSLFAIPFAWITGNIYGSALDMRYKFPIEFPIFLGLIGIFASLLSPLFMSCDLSYKTFMLYFVSTFIVAWSGMSWGIRKERVGNYPSKDT